MKNIKVIVIFMSMPDLVFVRLSCSKVGVLTVGTDTDRGLKTHIDSDTAYQYRYRFNTMISESVEVYP